MFAADGSNRENSRTYRDHQIWATVAQLVPVPADPRSMFGYMKGTVKIDGDIVAPLEVEWNAVSRDKDQLYGAKKPKRLRNK
jgi:hypothetical protein